MALLVRPIKKGKHSKLRKRRQNECSKHLEKIQIKISRPDDNIILFPNRICFCQNQRWYFWCYLNVYYLPLARWDDSSQACFRLLDTHVKKSKEAAVQAGIELRFSPKMSVDSDRRSLPVYRFKARWLSGKEFDPLGQLKLSFQLFSCHVYSLYWNHK